MKAEERLSQEEQCFLVCRKPKQSLLPSPVMVCNLAGSSGTGCGAGFYMLTLPLTGTVQRRHFWDNLCGTPASSPVLQAFAAGQGSFLASARLSLSVAQWLSFSK